MLNKKNKLAVVLLLAFSSLLLAQKAELDKAAPNFTLKDSNGKEHSLTDFKGKYVVLEWINFDCPFVEKHYDSRNMQNLQKEYTGKGVVWLAVCSSAPGKQGNFDNAEINKRLKDHGANLTAYLVDASGDVGRAYGAKTTPHMYVVNPEGTLVYAGGIDSIPSTDIDDIEEATNYVSAALDAAMNGNEIAGGSIRIFDSKLQAKMFKALGISDEEAEEKFGFLMNAFKYGAPPHGGIAFGFDRMVMLFAEASSIRDVIAFPKTASGMSLMDSSPSPVNDEQLKELHIKTRL